MATSGKAWPTAIAARTSGSSCRGRIDDLRGVGAALVLAVLLRAALPETAWETAGGFCLAVSIVAALAYSLRRVPRAS